MLKWFKRLRFENITVNGVLIKEKALYFAKELTFENFQASDGWLDKWKKRLGLIFFISTLLLYSYSSLGSLSLRMSILLEITIEMIPSFPTHHSD